MKYEHRAVIIGIIEDIEITDAEADILADLEDWSGSNGGYMIELTDGGADRICGALRANKEIVSCELVGAVQQAIEDGVEELYIFAQPKK